MPTDRCPPRVRTSFTLIELLVVIATIAVLASLLMPALAKARKRAKVSLCTAQLRQHGVAHAMYQGDYDGYFPVFGGELDPTEPNGKSDEYGRPWQLSGPSSTSYIEDYQPEIQLNYCPVVTFRTFESTPKAVYGEVTFAVTANTRYDQPDVVGYNFYTGRVLGKKSGSTLEHNTILRRFDGEEVIITDHLNQNTGSNRTAATNSGSLSSTAIPWLNPHVDRSCTPTLTGSANQLLADNSVHQVALSSPLRRNAFGYKSDTRSFFVGEVRSVPHPQKFYYYAYNGQ